MIHCAPRATASRLAGLFLAAAILGGCASQTHRAPVEERAGPAPAVAEAPKPLPGIENAGKPGYYTVKPGDTLIRISLDSGQNWRDLVKWNSLENPNIIEVGQVLRVVPPGVDAAAPAAKPIVASKIEARPLDAKPGTVAAASSPAASAPSANGTSAASTASATAAGAGAAAAATTTKDGDDNVSWMWPSGGPVLAQFEDPKRKGVAIGGKPGDPVLATADGRVVYAGSGLRGYGNLVIIKHNATYLSAYAHNQALLVKEDQAVRRGQKIAEMGSTDAERVELHFEIRKQGRPVDPLKLLPPR